MRVLDTLLSPNGRITRARFWGAYIGLGVVGGAIFYGADMMQDRLAKAPFWAVVVLAVPLIWINFCLLVKRWHDRNRSGMWLFINLIPGVGQLWTLLECGFIAGSPGNNKYGPATSVPGPIAATFGEDMPEDMADHDGTVFLVPEHT